jgi:hypothetical protein
VSVSDSLEVSPVAEARVNNLVVDWVEPGVIAIVWVEEGKNVNSVEVS